MNHQTFRSRKASAAFLCLRSLFRLQDLIYEAHLNEQLNKPV